MDARLKEETEDKISDNQFGFSEERGTIDEVYVLNYVIYKEIRKGGKIFTFFADLKATFNKMDRQILRERLRKIAVRRELRRKIIEIYKEMKNVIKIGKESSEMFWTHKELKQRSPESDVI